MPFISRQNPSIQLGLLSAIAQQHGHRADAFHLNLDFVAMVGDEAYDYVAEIRGPMTGDWLFSVEAFGSEAPDPHGAFLDRFAAEVHRLEEATSGHITAAFLRDLRDRVIPTYLDGLMESVRWDAYDVVGFSSTFQQTVASVALARRIKAAHPQVVTAFGGANFEAGMGVEYVRTVDVIDYAVSGEGEDTFPELLAAIAAGEDASTVPGVLSRRDGKVVVAPSRPPNETLDRLPTPIYDDFFDRAESLGLLEKTGRRAVPLPFESARGCWWGAKRHCTFCGLNGGTMTFRKKSPQRVFTEVTELARRYRSFHLVAMDNIIAEDYFDSLLPMLRATGSTLKLWYEIEANLTRDHIRQLRDSGFYRVQPGIESLSSHTLGLMRKGVRASTNVNVLRWAHYYGVRVAWNIIWGFPGERADEVEAQTHLVRRLVHLEPPSGSGRIWLERFSPLFTDREAFPAVHVDPEPSLQYVYPEKVDLNEAAYFFSYSLENTLDDATFLPLGAAIDDWQKAWKDDEAKRPALRYWFTPGILQIDDHRSATGQGTYTIDEPLGSLYVACSEAPISARKLIEKHQLPWSEADITTMLDDLVQDGLMMRDGNLFLALALPAKPTD